MFGLKTSSVALIGGDGAGKTTVARALEESSTMPAKYMYMGLSSLSSDRPLPTTRIVRAYKLRKHRKAVEGTENSAKPVISSHNLHYSAQKRGKIWNMLRAVNRLLEVVYRQMLSLIYQLRGYVVIYDRHYIFEISYRSAVDENWNPPTIERFEVWILKQLYLEPQLIVFLDAPPEVLFERKGEATIDYLELRRNAILKMGKQMNNFVRVDATRPLEQVLDEVTGLVRAALPVDCYVPSE